MVRALTIPLSILLSAFTVAQDVSVSELGRSNGSDSYVYWGSHNGIAAYSVATTACNLGTIPLAWRDSIKDAPVIGTNMFRIFDGRIEQLGYSFVKYSFCALDASSPFCASGCQNNSSCDWLGVHCADTYWASLNDGKNGGGRWDVEPTIGTWPSGPPTPPNGHQTIRGRLQVKESEMAISGQIYLVEGQYISTHDQLAGNGRNNYAYRQINAPSISSISNAKLTVMGDPAVVAWQAYHDDVLITEMPLKDEGGSGVSGWFFLGSRAIDLGGGQWRYEYALQNGNSNRSAQSFSVRLPCDPGLVISDEYFHDIKHHSGTPFAGKNWAYTLGSADASWACDDFATNPLANALRWGTLFNFAFTANRAPGTGRVELGLFLPGSPNSISGYAIAPSAEFPEYCVANANSTGNPAHLTATGSPYVDDQDLMLDVVDLPASNFGYFLMAETQGFTPLVGGSQGNLCLGSPFVRFSKDVLNTGASGSVTFQPDFDDLPQNKTFDPGDSWNMQFWYRDANPGQTSNMSQGVNIIFCP